MNKLPNSEYIEEHDLIRIIELAENNDYQSLVSTLDRIIYDQRQQEADYQYEEHGPWD